MYKGHPMFNKQGSYFHLWLMMMEGVLLSGMLLILLASNRTRFAQAQSQPIAEEFVSRAFIQMPSIRTCPPDIQLGETIQCTIALPSEVDQYQFSGEDGDKLLVRLATNGGLWSGVAINDPNGDSLPSCNGTGSSSTEFTCVLTATGTHHFRIYDGFNGVRTGTYHLYFQRVNKTPISSVPIEFGQTISGSISYPAEMDTYAFQARSGSKASVRLATSAGVWAGVQILDSQGKLPQPGCIATGSSLAVIDNCQLSENDQYRLLTFDSFNRTLTGTYNLTLECRNPPCAIPPSLPLVLIYAVLDNNLGDDPETWERLVNNAEAGVHSGVNVRLMVDGPGTDDAYVYNLEQDTDRHCPRLSDPTCGGRYNENVKKNFKKWREDTAHPYALRDFVNESITSYASATRIILALVGHGSGWSASALPGQPSRYVPQPGEAEIEERVGGLLWDDYPGDGGTSRSLSTKALGAALAAIKRAAGRSIDLLYLDACSMGMTEVAYEVRNSVNYLLASPNTDWASFAYSETLKHINNERPIIDIGKYWLAAEAKALSGESYPFTLGLYDLSQSANLSNTMNALSLALVADIVTYKPLLTGAINAIERFESDYNGIIDTRDNYIDLQSLLLHLAQQPNLPSNITAAIQAVTTTLATFIVDHQLQNGRPWLYPNHEWRWNEAKGLSIYLPLLTDEPKRALYTAGNLHWAQATAWDELLTAYWQVSEAQVALQTTQAELPTCHSTRNCVVDLPKSLGFPKVYLPLVRK